MTSDETKQYITNLRSVERQIGEHVLELLADPEHIATLTIVIPGVGTARVASIPLTREELGEVEQLLVKIEAGEPTRVPCVGFHCRLKDADKKEERRDNKWSEEAMGND